MKNQLLGDKAFYRRVFLVAVPIMVQNGITTFVNLLDNLMIGRVGTAEMSGVAVSNQLLFIFNLFIFGAVSGAGIFGAQFFGNDDHEGVRYTFRYKLIICTVLTVAGVALFLTFGPALIDLYLKGEGSAEDAAATLAYGKQYIDIMLIGLFPFAFAQVYASTLRECGETILPMKAGIIAVLVNLVFNYILIFGNLGAPRLGVAGAAIATVLSRFVEMFIVVSWTHRHCEYFPFIIGAYQSLHIPKELFWNVTKRGTPLLLNEGLWAAGIALLNQCYSIRSLDVVAAINICSTLSNAFSCVYHAMGNAIGILVGQELGAGRFEDAKTTANRMIFTSVMMSLAIGTLIYVTAPYFPMLYNTTHSVRELARGLCRVMAILTPFMALANALYFTLRAGGKTVITFLFDSAFVWCINIPLAFILSRYTAMPILPLYFCCQSMEMIKSAIGFVLVKKGVWIHNIVSETKK